MSVERQARKALRRMVFYRLLGECFTLPQALLRMVMFVGEALGHWFRNIEMAVFMLELDAARRYTLLTGQDLSAAGGDPARYGLVNNPELAQNAQDAFVRRKLVEEDE